MSDVYFVGQPELDSPSKKVSLTPPAVDQVLDWKLDKAKTGVDPWRVLYKVRWFGYSQKHDSWEPKDSFDGPPQIYGETIARVRAREPDKQLPDEMWSEVDALNLALRSVAGKKGLGKHESVGKASQVVTRGKTKAGAKKASTTRETRANESPTKRAAPDAGRPKADLVPKLPESKSMQKHVVGRKIRVVDWVAPPPRGSDTDADSVMHTDTGSVEDVGSRSAGDNGKAALSNSTASDVTSDGSAEDSDDDGLARSSPPVTRQSETSKKRKNAQLMRTTSAPISQLGKTLLHLPSFKVARPVAAEPPNIEPDVNPSQGPSIKEPALRRNRAPTRREIPSRVPPASEPTSRLPPARASVDPALLGSQPKPQLQSTELLRSRATPVQKLPTKAYIHPSRAALLGLALPPSEPDVHLLQPTPAPAPSVAGSVTESPPSKRRKKKLPVEDEDAPAVAPVRAVVLPPRELFEPALAAPARKGDIFNHGLERTKAKAGFVVLDPPKLLAELRQLSGELPVWLRKSLVASYVAQDALRTAWNVGKRWSDDFENKVKGRTAWIFCPIAHATLKQLADASPAGKAFKKRKVQAHYLALQIIIEGFGVKQADMLRDGVEVVFVHASEESELGLSHGPLARLDEFRRSGGPESVCYSFGGQTNGFYQLWCTHAAVTFSPRAFLDDPEEMETILVQASKIDKDTTRSVCVWAPAALAATAGPLSCGSIFANYFENPDDLFKRLVNDGTLHLAKSLPTADAARSGKVFPAPEDEESILTDIQRTEVSIESIVQCIERFRRQYVQVRHWFVIATAEEISSVTKVPGVELILRKDAPAALFV